MHSSCTVLRSLSMIADVARDAFSPPDGLPDDATRGCSGSLYRLTVFGTCDPSGSLFMSPLSFPLLTELTVNDQPMSDAELELLLPACPQLLRLECTVSESWQVMLVAARCCPRLLELRLHVGTNYEQESRGRSRSAAARAQQCLLPTAHLPRAAGQSAARSDRNQRSQSSGCSLPRLTPSCGASSCMAAASLLNPCYHWPACRGFVTSMRVRTVRRPARLLRWRRRADGRSSRCST
jgi:hypothetical protein